MSSSDFALFIDTVAGIWTRCFNLLNRFTIAGIPLFTIFLALLGVSILFAILHNLSIGGK